MSAYEAVRLRRSTKKLGGKAYLGKKTITSGVMRIRIVGMFPYSVFERAWRMKESGIIAWWHELLDLMSAKQKILANIPVAPAKISGNLLVVSIIYLFGVLISLAVLIVEANILCENAYRICSWLLAVIRHVFKNFNLS